MEASDVADDVIELLDELASKNVEAVKINDLKNYLSALKRDASSSNEHLRRLHEQSLAHYQATNQASMEMFRSVMDAGKSALQTLLLINGGAVVALLGVFSTLANNSDANPLAYALALPMLQFGIGVLFGAIGFAFRYLNQFFLHIDSGAEGRWEKAGLAMTGASIISGLTGYVLFALGIANAYYSISNYFSP